MYIDENKRNIGKNIHYDNNITDIFCAYHIQTMSPGYIPMIHDMFIGHQSKDYTKERGRPSMLHKLHEMMHQQYIQ